MRDMLVGLPRMSTGVPSSHDRRALRTPGTSKVAALVVWLVLLAGCTAGAGPESTTLDGSESVLIALPGGDPLPGIRITTDLVHEEVSGSAGCNAYSDYLAGRASLRLVGYLGIAWARALAISGDTAYLGQGPVLTILSISTLERIERLGYLVFPHAVSNVALAGRYAYVVTDGDTGLYIVDAQEPRCPRLVGRHDTGALITGVKVSGGHAYVTNGNLHVLALSTPAAPSVVGMLSFPGGPPSSSGRVAAVVGGYAYTLYQDAFPQSGGLRILDVSDPTEPTQLGSVGLVGWPTDLAVAAKPGGVVLYLLSGYGNPHLTVVDASDPKQPAEVDLDLANPWISWGVAMAGDLVLLGAPDTADGPDVIRILDIGKPSDPKEIGRYAGIARSPIQIVAYDDLAYIAAGDGLAVLSLADPSAPSMAGAYQPRALPLPTERVTVAGDGYAYVATGENGLQIVNVSDPASSQLAASLVTGGHAWATALSPVDSEQAGARYAYVADEFNGLRVIDVSNPLAPVEAGAYDPPGRMEFFHGVATDARGRYAHVADGGLMQTGLRILDVSDPARLHEVGFFPLAKRPGDTSAARVEDVASAEEPGQMGIIYVAAGTAGLRVVDVSDPAAPTEVGVLDTPGRADKLAVCGHLVCLVDGDLRIVDVSDQVARPGGLSGPAGRGLDAPRGGWQLTRQPDGVPQR